MTTLTTQKDALAIRDLPFCYICGSQFDVGDAIDYDHVLPKAIFDPPDRNFPIKLAAHRDRCHSPMNLDDEIIGQLLSLIHGKRPSDRNNKLKIELYKRLDSGELLASFNQRSIEFLIRRWLKGFHAALYRSPLPEGTEFAIQTPFPSGTIHKGHIEEDPIKEQHFEFVECIKRNRVARNLDRIECNNKKLRYECVWDQLSNQSWACIFAIDLYGWIDLGDVNNFKPRGCTGLYIPPSGIAPSSASLATKLEFKLPNKYTADPFGQ